MTGLPKGSSVLPFVEIILEWKKPHFLASRLIFFPVSLCLPLCGRFYFQADINYNSAILWKGNRPLAALAQEEKRSFLLKEKCQARLPKATANKHAQ
jgi:hypothetical protein